MFVLEEAIEKWQSNQLQNDVREENYIETEGG